MSSRQPPVFSSTRRLLLQALPLLALASNVFAQEPAPPIKLLKLNTFEIRVSDPARSLDWYQGLFGMPVQGRQGDRVALRIGAGPQHMVLRPLLEGETPAITHLGYSVENFDPEDTMAALEGLGYTRIEAPDPSLPGIENAMSTWLRERGETVELYFADERGLIVQLSGADYCGGGGERGEQCSVEEAPEGLLNLQDINHFTAFVSNGAEANRYYQETFGLKPQAFQGPNSPVTGIGDGYQFVMYAGGGGGSTPANLHHGSLSVEDFDVERIRGIFTDYGLTARPEGQNQTGPLMHYISLRMPERGGAEGGTPELYFTDPDGILLQLQDPSYCGGGGKLGEICQRD